MTILITGATGRTALRISKLLQNSNHDILLTSRSPEKVEARFKAVRFDWFDEETWEEPFKAASFTILAVYLLGPPGVDSTPIMKSFIEFAKIVEENAVYSGTKNALIPFISADDIARVAHKALTADKSFNTDLVLVGPRLIRYDDVARGLTNVLGRPIAHNSLSLEDITKYRIEKQGMVPPVAAKMGQLESRLESGAEEKWFTEKNVGIAALEAGEPLNGARVIVGEKRMIAHVKENADVWR